MNMPIWPFLKRSDELPSDCKIFANSKLAVFEKVSIQKQSYTKIMREQERNVFSFADFAKIWAKFGKNFPFFNAFYQKGLL